jgi:hypothetical protein
MELAVTGLAYEKKRQKTELLKNSVHRETKHRWNVATSSRRSKWFGLALLLIYPAGGAGASFLTQS